jgi:hypothetical protein
MDGFTQTLGGETLASFGDDEPLKVLHRVPIIGRLKLTQIFFFTLVVHCRVHEARFDHYEVDANNISSNRNTSDIPSRPALEELYAPRSGIETFAPLEVIFTMPHSGRSRFTIGQPLRMRCKGQPTMHRVECEEHGFQDETCVCKHLVSSSKTHQVVGFYWASEPRGDAWCDVCEKVRIAEGGASGDWNDRSEAFAGIQLLCGCHDLVRGITARTCKHRGYQLGLAMHSFARDFRFTGPTPSRSQAFR